MRVLRRGAIALAQRYARLIGVRQLFERVGPTSLRPSPPRYGSGRVDVDAARPVFFPQVGHGTMRFDAETSDAPRTIRAACRHDRVIIPVTELERPSVRAAAFAAACAGAPLEFDHPPAVHAQPLDEWTTRMIDLPRASDGTSREARSVRIRRAALFQLGLLSPDRTVSVLLASRRPERLLGAIDQIRVQQHVSLQLIVGLHGPDWDDQWEQRLRTHWDAPLSVVRAGNELSFGDLLTQLGSRAEGELITKWDDDDWYGEHHVMDLILAFQYSGAELVGKAAEFVHLADGDRTIRRLSLGAESYSETLAGGAMLASRAWLEELGWWPEMRAGVDKHLIERTRQHGGRCYRLHGFEYVLRRTERPADHTWNAPASRFEQSATAVRPGLALGFAGFSAGRSFPD